jgi:hypothetical protein
MAKTRKQPAVKQVKLKQVKRKPAREPQVDPTEQKAAMRSLLASRVRAGVIQLEDLPDEELVQAGIV